jgi:hypothetical protein
MCLIEPKERENVGHQKVTERASTYQPTNKKEKKAPTPFALKQQEVEGRVGGVAGQQKKTANTQTKQKEHRQQQQHTCQEQIALNATDPLFSQRTRSQRQRQRSARTTAGRSRGGGGGRSAKREKERGPNTQIRKKKKLKKNWT